MRCPTRASVSAGSRATRRRMTAMSSRPTLIRADTRNLCLSHGLRPASPRRGHADPRNGGERVERISDPNRQAGPANRQAGSPWRYGRLRRRHRSCRETRTVRQSRHRHVCFLPIWVVEKRNVSFDRRGGLRRQLGFLERPQDRLRPKHKDIRIVRDRTRARSAWASCCRFTPLGPARAPAPSAF
jgi:hypothetical protein